MVDKRLQNQSSPNNALHTSLVRSHWCTAVLFGTLRKYVTFSNWIVFKKHSPAHELLGTIKVIESYVTSKILSFSPFLNQRRRESYIIVHIYKILRGICSNNLNILFAPPSRLEVSTIGHCMMSHFLSRACIFGILFP